MRIGYNIDTITSVDIQEFVKIGGKVIQIHEGVVYRETFNVTPIRNVIDSLFASGQKYKVENNDWMHLLVKLLLNALYGENMRQDIEENFARKSDFWMMSENDEWVKEYWKLSHENYFVEMIDDKGLEDEVEKLDTMPLNLGVFVLSNNKTILNNFINAFNGFYTNDLY